MTDSEDLNAYQDAYKRKFEFFNENQWYLNHYAKRVCRVMRDHACRSALSLGIGHEVVLRRILEEFEHSLETYTILEGSADIIRKLHLDDQYANRVSVIHTYFEEYSLSSDVTYDAIEIGFVLEHVDDPLFIVEKFKSCLSHHGTMFIAVPNARSLHRLIGYEANLLDDVYRLGEADYKLGHKRYFDLDSISSLIESAGLRITHRQGLMLKPITGAQISMLGWDDNIIQALFKIGDRYPDIANCILIEAAL